ncbi:hypothetical protein EU522_01495 [Candidatus Thorarchaeota archaeon]|nr:MAG: hypothetical protein EU522_01495 [Candidatus Thorarchaeota archaeon]
MANAGFVIGFILICAGLVIPYLWQPSDIHIDPGPTPVEVIASGLIFTGLNVFIISGIFFLRNAIRTKKEKAGHSLSSDS